MTKAKIDSSTIVKEEKDRPASVPQEAKWNPSDNEWELGIRNEK
ncbi:MAG: hypothetical protein AB8B74_08195 [Crocinitomicaceae bacterium]